jgi:hypothetical protein
MLAASGSSAISLQIAESLKRNSSKGLAAAQRLPRARRRRSNDFEF